MEKHEQMMEIGKDWDCDEGDLSQLPQVRDWDGSTLYQFQGFWFNDDFLRNSLAFRKRHKAQQGDVVVATFPKSGTTWLKAIAFCIINRTHHSPSIHNKTHPLLSSNPHDLVPFAEVLYRNNKSPSALHLKARAFSTHLPFTLLPTCISDDLSNTSRVLYICRNPLDQFVSSYHYFHKMMLRNHPNKAADDLDGLGLLDEAFDLFCRGIQKVGPSLDHHLSYWRMSIERPDKVLFLKYEHVKEYAVGCAEKVAEFLGCPFSQQEETQGVILDIVKLCSFEYLTDLEVNKTGKSTILGLNNNAFFRKGEVGDWANYLTPPMVERARTIVEEKLAGSGLTFKFFGEV